MNPEPRPDEGSWRAVQVWLTPMYLDRLERAAAMIGIHPGQLLREAAVEGLRIRVEAWRKREAELRRAQAAVARRESARAIVEATEARGRNERC